MPVIDDKEMFQRLSEDYEMTKTQADQILMDLYSPSLEKAMIPMKVPDMRFPVAAPLKRPDDICSRELLENERLTRRDPPLQIQQTATVVEPKAVKVTEIHSAAIFDIIPAVEDEAQRNVAARRILRCFSSNFSEKTLELSVQDNKFAIGFELNTQECAAFGIDQIDEHGLAVILACAKSFIAGSRGAKTPYYRAMIIFGVNEPRTIELGFESKLSNYLQSLGEKYQEWLSAPVSSFPTYLEDLAETATQIQLSNNKEMDLFIKKGGLQIYGTLGTITTTAAAFALIGPITGIITLCVCLFVLGAVHRTLSS